MAPQVEVRRSILFRPSAAAGGGAKNPRSGQRPAVTTKNDDKVKESHRVAGYEDAVWVATIVDLHAQNTEVRKLLYRVTNFPTLCASKPLRLLLICTRYIYIATLGFLKYSYICTMQLQYRVRQLELQAQQFKQENQQLRVEKQALQEKVDHNEKADSIEKYFALVCCTRYVAYGMGQSPAYTVACVHL